MPPQPRSRISASSTRGWSLSSPTAAMPERSKCTARHHGAGVGDRPPAERIEGLRPAPTPLGRRAQLRMVRKKPQAGKGLRDPHRNSVGLSLCRKHRHLHPTPRKRLKFLIPLSDGFSGPQPNSSSYSFQIVLSLIHSSVMRRRIELSSSLLAFVGIETPNLFSVLCFPKQRLR